MISNTEARRSKGVDDLIRRYSPKIPEKIKEAARTSPSSIQHALSIFETCLEPELDLDEIEGIVNQDIPHIFNPQEIDLFLQAASGYQESTWYKGAMGVFLTVLMEKSTAAGYNSFTLRTRGHLQVPDCLDSSHRRNPKTPIQLIVEGDVGDYFCSWAENTYAHVKGNTGEDCAGHLKYSTLEVDGNMDNFYCGQNFTRSTLIVHGEVYKVSVVSSREARNLTIKTSNEITLQKFLDTTPAGCDIYFINKDGTEVLVE